MKEELFLEYKMPLIFGGVGLVMLVLALILSWQQPGRLAGEQVEIMEGEASVSAELAQETILVDIEGAVAVPGVYELLEGARVADLLEKAGGLNKKADFSWVAQNINRAKKLGDGEKIYIPYKSQNSNLKAQSRSSKTININTASRSELESLAGIGIKTAEKIIAGRPYSRIEELLERKIVGKATFEKIKEKIGVF